MNLCINTVLYFTNFFFPLVGVLSKRTRLILSTLIASLAWGVTASTKDTKGETSPAQEIALASIVSTIPTDAIAFVIPCSEKNKSHEYERCMFENVYKGLADYYYQAIPVYEVCQTMTSSNKLVVS